MWRHCLGNKVIGQETFAGKQMKAINEQDNLRLHPNAEKDLISINSASNKETWRSMIELQRAKSIKWSNICLDPPGFPCSKYRMTMVDHEWPSVTINKLYHALVTSSITSCLICCARCPHSVACLVPVAAVFLAPVKLLSLANIRNTLVWIGRLANIAKGTNVCWEAYQRHKLRTICGSAKRDLKAYDKTQNN